MFWRVLKSSESRSQHAIELENDSTSVCGRNAWPLKWENDEALLETRLKCKTCVRFVSEIERGGR